MIPPPAAPRTDEENKKSMGDWKNPKMKVKKEAVALSPESIMSRISDAGIPFTLYPISCPDRDTMVSREFMSTEYGGSSQATFPRIGKKKLEKHGLDDFMYLPTDFQPHAPEVPGAPGLFLNVDGNGGEFSSGVVRVFTRITKGPALWLYQGQYEVKSAKTLTKEEWASQKPLMRNMWAKDIYTKNWGISIKSIIYARKHLGRYPTKKEYEDTIRKKYYQKVEQSEIALALTRGEIHVDVFTMKCVGYDSAFQTQVAKKFESFVPRARKSRTGATKRSTTSDEATVIGARRRPTKRQKLAQDVVDVDMLSSDDEDDDGLEYVTEEDEEGGSKSELDSE